jgi:hypothetical protein
MWNSPHSETKAGKRYRLRDLAALTYSLGNILDFLESSPVAVAVEESILQRMDRDELIYAIYQVVDALLEATPIPKGGHRGYHEAIIAELLHHTFELVTDEAKDATMGDSARKAAWTSLNAFCLTYEAKEGKQLPQLQDLGLNFDNPLVHRSKKITTDHWDDLLLGAGGLWDEFLWDDDWRMDHLMDRPTHETKNITALTGIDLETVHALPHTPTRAELDLAERYLRNVIRKSELPGPARELL